MTDSEFIHLKELMETKFEAVDQRFNSVDGALTLAREQLEKRLELMNEFRASLKDAQSTYITKTEYDANHQRICDKLEMECKRLQEKIDEAGRGKVSWLVATIVTILTATTIALTVALVNT